MDIVMGWGGCNEIDNTLSSPPTCATCIYVKVKIGSKVLEKI